MAPRKKGQTVGGRFVFQGVDPLTGRRLHVRAASLAELESRRTRILGVRDGLRYGDISVHEAEGLLRPAVGMATRVRDLWMRYVAGLPGPSERTARSTWRTMLERPFGDLAVWDLSETRMRVWKTDLDRARLTENGPRGYAPKTVRKAFDFLRACVTLAQRDGVISGLPWGQFSVASPKSPRSEREALRDPGELVAILLAARAWDEAHHRTAEARLPVLLVLLLTGLRQAEACGLAWEDLDLERPPYHLHIRHQARAQWPALEGGKRPLAAPKGGVQRDQLLHPDVVQALLHHRRLLRAAGRYREDGPVFPRPGTAKWRTNGQALDPEAFRDCVRLAGLPNVGAWTTHSTRHSFARLELVGHGGDLRSVGERTGHKDLSVLEGYLRKASRGGGGSRIPSLPLVLGPPALEAHGSAPLPLLPGFCGDPAELRGDSAEIPLRELGEPEPPLSWPDLARAWLAAGSRGVRPHEVTRALAGHYSRGHAREYGRTKDHEKAKAAGQRARRAALGAWAKILAAARRVPF